MKSSTFKTHISFLLFGLSIVSSYRAAGFVASPGLHIKKRDIPRKFTSLKVIDQIVDAGNTAVFVDPPAVSSFVDGFTSTFSSRFIGTILGNIAATIALKFLSDYLWASAKTKYEEFMKPTPPSSATFTTTSNSIGGTSSSSSSSLPPNNSSTSTELPITTYAWFQLLLCIFIDLAGDSSFILPGVGEVEDTIWAPLSAYFISNIFNSNALTTLDFIKEILPGTDIVPVATLAWIIKYKFPFSPAAKLLNLTPTDIPTNVIDTTTIVDSTTTTTASTTSNNNNGPIDIEKLKDIQALNELKEAMKSKQSASK